MNGIYASPAAVTAQLSREMEPAAPWAGELRIREYAFLFVSLICLGLLIPPSYSAVIALTVAGVYVVGSIPTTRGKRLLLVLLVLFGFSALTHLVSRPRLANIIWGGLGLELFLVLRAVDWAVSTRSDTLSGPTRDRLGRFLLYLFFLPTLFAGPVERYVDFYRSYRPFRGDWLQRLAANSSKIVWGAARYFVLAFYLREAAFSLKATAEAGQSFFGLDPRLLLWAYVALFIVFTYVQFCGFCDMGIGVSRIIGFQVRDNFDKALLSTSPPRYWKSMNISTYRFLMTHVFYPYWEHSQLNRKIMTTFLVSAVWHWAVTRTTSLDAAIQLLLAVSIYGMAVLTTLRLARTGVGRAVEWLRRTPARPVLWSAQWLLTLLFTAVVHQLFWAGMSGQALGINIELFRRLFLGGIPGAV